MTGPNARERKALEVLRFQEWERQAQLCVGQKTFNDLIAKGWIAPFEGFNPNGDRFSITDLGRKALSVPQPPRVRSAPRLAELPVRLKPLSGRFDPPKK